MNSFKCGRLLLFWLDQDQKINIY
jgi:Ca2+ transporting ATPase